MPDEQFDLMRRILAAPSPIGLEGAMTHGVLEPYFRSFMPDGWAIHRFRGNAGIVLDSMPDADPNNTLSVMLIGHADKIRMQVRSIGPTGKIWVNSDSFLAQTLIGHEVQLFSENPEEPGSYRILEGGTIEAVGAIHFAAPKLRSGTDGIKGNMLYLELQVHGEKKKAQIEALGIRPGDPILLKRPIRRGFSPDTFYGAYLDNGLGCFVTAETARLVAEHGGFDHVRCLFGIATHEEIGRYGSRVMARKFAPDVLIGADVSHDFKSAPGVGGRRYPPIAMGQGFSLDAGSITSAQLNTLIAEAAKAHDVPMQFDFGGRDTGTDAMAGVFAAIDTAATSVGFPIRNMHTISESGHTADVLSAIWGMYYALESMDEQDVMADDFRTGHPRLDHVTAIEAIDPATLYEDAEADEDEEEDD